MNLTPELRNIRNEIEGYAKDYGLDFFKTIFEILDYKQINEVASYDGFPVRYPHWHFGMNYYRMSKSSEYGLHKIYEMVINNDPCYAYLLEGNALVDQKTVIAHVYAHCDFFKNNIWFSKTNRNMIDEIANHSSRIRRYTDLYGIDKVEDFLDTCLSLQDLINVHSPFIGKGEAFVDEEKPEEGEIPGYKKIKTKEYMDSYINPPEYVAQENQKLEDKKISFPSEPRQDVLRFLIEYSPLEDWQNDILNIVREESYYFAPQRQTKIMNEGWAAYWHSKIMREKACDDSEIIDFADHHSGILFQQPGGFNPYRMGIRLFEDIERRWNKGMYGKEYNECDDMCRKNSWDKKLGKGRDKIFEVRKIHNDITFIDEFLTDEFCTAQKLFAYEVDERTGQHVISSRSFEIVKSRLLSMLTNGGNPFIFVTDGNFRNRGELLLSHRYDGIDLDIEKAMRTLENVHKIWSRPVNLFTFIGGQGMIFGYDGNEHSTAKVSSEGEILPSEDTGHTP